MLALVRTISFILFTLVEYVRSGRILIELVAVMLFYYAFFMRQLGGDVRAENFFILTGIFMLVLTLYTMSSFISLGDRPQGYVILARQMGRTGFLLGLYSSAALTVFSMYLFLSFITSIIGIPDDLTLAGWLFGSIPLLLNAALFMALLLILSPLVFSTGWRLFTLLLIALAFSGNFISGPVFHALPETVKMVLNGVQTILSWPLVPIFSGFALAIHRNLSIHALVVIVSQGSLLVALLGLALYAFSRRETILSSE